VKWGNRRIDLRVREKSLGSQEKKFPLIDLTYNGGKRTKCLSKTRGKKDPLQKKEAKRKEGKTRRWGEEKNDKSADLFFFGGNTDNPAKEPRMENHEHAEVGFPIMKREKEGTHNRKGTLKPNLIMLPDESAGKKKRIKLVAGDGAMHRGKTKNGGNTKKLIYGQHYGSHLKLHHKQRGKQRRGQIV